MSDLDDFVSLLKQARVRRDAELMDRFDRSLPFGDAMFDRWERARALGFGDDASVYDSALVFGSVEVGDHAWIGPNVLLDGSGGLLRIGAWCSISSGTHIYTHDASVWSVSGGRLPPRTAPVHIGDRCFIGAQSVVMPGVRIGDQSVVGANSFVNRDIPSRQVFAGNPAVRIGDVVDDGDQISFVYDRA